MSEHKTNVADSQEAVASRQRQAWGRGQGRGRGRQLPRPREGDRGGDTRREGWEVEDRRPSMEILK